MDRQFADAENRHGSVADATTASVPMFDGAFRTAAVHGMRTASAPALQQGTVALSPRSGALRLFGASSACPSKFGMAATSVAPPQPALQGVYAVLDPQSKNGGGCFLSTQFQLHAPLTPKVKQMECLLMSPTRRTAMKPQTWQWDYGTTAAMAGTPKAPAQAVSKGPFKEEQLPQSPLFSGSGAADAAAAAVGALHMGTPVALASGQLSDSCDT